MMEMEAMFHQKDIYLRSHPAEVPTYLLEYESNVPPDLHPYLASRMVSKGDGWATKTLEMIPNTTLIISQQ